MKGAHSLGSPAVKRGAATAEKLACIDTASVRAARTAMPEDRMVRALAETFSALSDPTRIRILSALGGQEQGSPIIRWTTITSGTSWRNASSTSP